MRAKTSHTINELRDYSSLFTRNEVLKWCSNDLTSIKLKIERYGSPCKIKSNTYLTYLKHIYSILVKFYPNEYIYKNEFLNKWLLKELGVSDSVVFNEFRVGNAVADLVMFNGNSKVFEIKTLLDNDTRLSNQLLEYSKIFNEVYLVIPASKLTNYLEIDTSVGLITYNEENSKFNLIRNAKIKLEINCESLMNVLHTKEYISIVEKHIEKKIVYNDFNKFDICKQLISKLPKELLSSEFVSLMKKRGRNNFFSKKEKEFNQIFLSMNFNTKRRDALLNKLKLSTY